MSSLGQPVQIVRLDKKSNGLELNIDALAEICLNEKCRERPVCVVSIAGDFRKGKSFMLNFFLRYLYHVSEKQQQLETKLEEENGGLLDMENIDKDWLGDPENELKGFSWRGGSKPETTGILVWDDPIIIKRANGEEVAVLLMDTQGAFDSRQTIGQTAIIFALSTLTSSIQIYNVMNNIQEDNLQILDTFLAYGQLVLDRSSEKPFQELCFLVRDWRSPMDHAYGAEGGNSLLEEKLALDDEDPESSDNKTRKRIDSCFEKKNCFLLPFPGEKVSVEEGTPYKGQLAEMKENFVDHLRIFVPQILSPTNLLVKKIGGSTINGQSLLEYFRVYAETFKGEKIPEAKNLYDATAEASNLAAVANSKNFYLKSMKDICGAHKPYINPKILEQKHTQLLKESLEMFETTKKLGEEDYSRSFSDRLMKELVASFDEYVEMNNSKNMFNMWGSPLILLCFWFLAFTLSRLFEIIGIGPLANLFYLQATVSFISIIAYLSLKYTGNFPDIVVAVDKVAEYCWIKAMDTAIGQITQRVHTS